MSPLYRAEAQHLGTAEPPCNNTTERRSKKDGSTQYDNVLHLPRTETIAAETA